MGDAHPWHDIRDLISLCQDARISQEQTQGVQASEQRCVKMQGFKLLDSG